VVDYQGLVKRLNLPTGWAAPTELTNDDIRASALTRDHLHDDVRGHQRQPRANPSNARRPLADRAGHRGAPIDTFAALTDMVAYTGGQPGFWGSGPTVQLEPIQPCRDRPQAGLVAMRRLLRLAAR
jgi:hypothetical protein